MRPRIEQVFALSAAACLMACRTAAAGTGDTETRPDAVAVELGPVARGPLERPLVVGGTWKAKETADLSFKVGGVVATVLVEQGERVRRGQAIARVDGAGYFAGLLQAKAALAKADRDEKRIRTLREHGAVPEQLLDDGSTTRAVASAIVDSASSDANRTTLRAPDDGWIQRRSIEVGEVVAPGKPVFRFEGARRGKVARISVIDRDALALVVTTPCSLAFDAEPATKHACHVVETSRATKPGAALLDLEVALDHPTAASDYPEGLTVKVSFDRRPVTTSVPLASLVDENGDHAAVLAPTGLDAFRRIPVTVDFIVGNQAAVSELPADVGSVIVRGAARLRDGDRIRSIL